MDCLITKDDVNSIRPISDNLVDQKRLDPYIREAQNYELLDLLGEDLFYDFFANLTDTKYSELLNGASYTNDKGVEIEYRGMKKFISYYTVARMYHQQPYHTSKGGMVKKVVPESEAITGSELQSLINSVRNNGAAEANHIRMFLNDNRDTYPLWRCDSGGNAKSVGRFGAGVSAVGGTGTTDAYQRNDYLYE